MGGDNGECSLKLELSTQREMGRGRIIGTGVPNPQPLPQRMVRLG